ncbi:MAG TPA: hypothetical protein VF452_15025, partial [Candidatus Binatia bacterium]
WSISVLDDQAAAGAFMWVPGSLIFLVPVAVLSIGLFNSPQTRSAQTSDVPAKQTPGCRMREARTLHRH